MALAKFSEWVEFYENKNENENENAGGAVNMQMPPSSNTFKTGVEEPEVSEAELHKNFGVFKNQFENLMKRVNRTKRIPVKTSRDIIVSLLNSITERSNLKGTEKAKIKQLLTIVDNNPDQQQ